MPPLGKGLAVSVTGSTHDPNGIRSNVDPETHRRSIEGIAKKIREATGVTQVEATDIDDCEIGIVSFGITSRAAQDAVMEARDSGIKAGHLRLKTLWPFPDDAVGKLCNVARSVLVPEMNLGQICLEVQRVAPSDVEVVPLNKIGGGRMFTPSEILTNIKEKITI